MSDEVGEMRQVGSGQQVGLVIGARAAVTPAGPCEAKS